VPQSRENDLNRYSEWHHREFKRVQIQNHQYYEAWLASLPAHTKQMLEAILDSNLTPESILFAQGAPEAEWDQHQFVSIISDGESNSSQYAGTNQLYIDEYTG
jgi:hypothetical protein